jgi:DNA adenine methylase
METERYVNMAKSPMSWYGGKYYMANDIIPLFPEHKMYVEGFGGAAHILLKKPPSPMEVYNDIHSGLYTFFKLLREENAELIKAIQLTPYSRQQFNEDIRNIHGENNEIEKVRAFYCSTMQAVGCVGSGWSYAKTKSSRGMCGSVSQWLRNIDENLVDVIERLREIQIENIDIIKLIKKYDNESTLFYLDPPYIKDTRKSPNKYQHEMTNEQHMELVSTLLNVRGKVILSGYDHDIYKPLEENGWRKHFIGEYTKRIINTCNGQPQSKGQEFVWLNY